MVRLGPLGGRAADLLADDGGALGGLNPHFSHCCGMLAYTNNAEEFFSRMRRGEIGHHHRVACPYLIRYAQEASWREDHRRVDNGRQVQGVMGAGDGLPAERGLVRVLAALAKGGIAPLGASGAAEFHRRALSGRVEDWRAGLGRSSCSPLSRPFVCECLTISTVPRFQPPPRRTQQADFLALRSPVCFASRFMGPILPERLSAAVAEPCSC